MATQEFLSCLSKQAMTSTASANRVAPRNTGKETRAAMIAHVGTGTFVHPAALFAPNAKELQGHRTPPSLAPAEAGDSLDDEPDVQDAGGEAEDDLDAVMSGPDLDGENAEGGVMAPPGLTGVAEHQAAP